MLSLPPDILVTDPDVCAAHQRDQLALADSAVPAALARPRDTAEVAAVLRAAAAEGRNVVVRGAGSGLTGGANATEGSVVLSTERLRGIAIDDDLLTAGAGELTGAVKQAARAAGGYYPPDPASAAFSSIGGNVATNAGGLCCVRYGVTRDWVRGLTAVLPDGEVIRLGGRTRKNVAGLDLLSLLVGSEGTLAVITDVTVALAPPPPPVATVVATLPDLPVAAAAVADLLRAGLPLSLVELMDRTTVRAVDDWRRLGLDRDAAALLLVQCDTPAGKAAAKVLDAAGATDVFASDAPDEADMLLEARRLAFPALERLGPCLLDDVAVPRSAIVALVAGVAEIAERHDLTIGTFGHAGDGNLHPTILLPPGAPERGLAAFADIVALALRLGGTCTGEHGVGRLKAPFLAEQLGERVLQLNSSLRRVFDPTGLFLPVG